MLFGVAICLIARKSCNEAQRTHATLAFDVGSGNHVAGIEAEMFADGEMFATYRHADFTGSVKFETAFPGEDGEVHIELDTGKTTRTTVRHFHAVEGGTVTFPLAELSYAVVGRRSRPARCRA